MTRKQYRKHHAAIVKALHTEATALVAKTQARLGECKDGSAVRDSKLVWEQPAVDRWSQALYHLETAMGLLDDTAKALSK